MVLTAAELNDRLPQLGYEHLAFLSYARQRTPDRVTTLASARPKDLLRARTEKVKGLLQQELAKTFNAPSVFSDADIPDTAEWQRTLARSLYRSVVVIAICDPVYFTPTREWCAREWYGASDEHQRRPKLADRGVLIYGTTEEPNQGHYPAWAQQLQAIDLSGVSASGWSTRTRVLGNWIVGLRKHIEIVASHWITQGVAVLPGEPLLPAKGWPPPPQAPLTPQTPKYPFSPLAA